MRFPARAALLALALSALTACSKKDPTDPAALEAAFKEAPPAEAPAEAAAPAPEVAAPVADALPVGQLVTQAAAAMRKDEFSEAIVLLQSLRAQTRLTPEQRMAVQDAMANVQLELARLADAGDQRAKQALELINARTRW